MLHQPSASEHVGRLLRHQLPRLNPIVTKMENCIITAGLSGSGIMKADSVGRIAAALFDGKEEATLLGNRRISATKLGLVNRAVEQEKIVI